MSERLRSAIDVPFKRRTLRDIIVETQLCHSDILPDGNGVYRIVLLDEIWTGTEEEAFAFTASCLCPVGTEYCDDRKSSDLSSVRSSALHAISIIEKVFDFEAPSGSRLDDVRHRLTSNANRVVAAINRVKNLIETNDPSLLASMDPPWLCRFAHDLRDVESLVLTKREAARLRDATASESFKYEVMVIAAYFRNGAQVRITDDSIVKSPECNVTWDASQPVHIECKMKKPETVKRRDAQLRFEKLADDTFAFLNEIELCCDVRIESRFDPSDDDIVDVMSWLRENLTNGCILPKTMRKGAKSIAVYGESIFQADHERAVAMPRGYDFGRCEARYETPGKPKCAKSLVWKAGQRWRWIKSAIQTLKDTSQLPKHEPSIVYLAVPTGPFDVVWLRTELLAQEVRTLLLHDCRRVSMVVITGEATRIRKGGDGAPDVTVITTLFQTIENQQAHNPLPYGFKVYGRDFTR